MPGRQTHSIAGVAAGGLTALARTPTSFGRLPLPEALGGIAGGYIGGRLPDLIEPATSSWHRGIAHSGVLGAILVSTGRMLEEWERYCRLRAEHHRLLRTSLGTGQGYHLWHSMVEWFWRFLAGLAAGLLAGYLSHLGLDAITPRSIPILA